MPRSTVMMQVVFGIALAGLSACVLATGGAAEQPPAANPQPAQIFVRLIGTST